MGDSLRVEMEFAAETAWAAGRVTLRYFQTGVEAERKADDTPVTIADREAEQAIRRQLERAFPDDGLVGEEYGRRDGPSGRHWYIDPIDGTKSFVAGVPLYGVLLGLEDERGACLAGAVYLPALDELLCAGRGEGCWWNGRRAAVSTVADLAAATLCYTSARSFGQQGRGAAWAALAQRVRLVRGWGDCYGHLLVATGRAEVMLDPIMSAWDCGPFPVLLEEAGGSFTDWRGTTTIHGADAVSTNGLLSGDVLRLLQP